MTYRIPILAACALFALTPAARAQSAGEPIVAVDVSAMSKQFMEQIGPMAAAAGLEPPALTARFAPLVRAATPVPPPNDAVWAFNIELEWKISVSEDGSLPEGRLTRFDDAQSCIAASPNPGPMVYFRRIATGGLKGHQCVMAWYQGESWVLVSYAYAEGADRHLIAEYAAAATVPNERDGVRAIAEPVIEANIALAVAHADLALDATHRAEPDPRD